MQESASQPASSVRPQSASSIRRSATPRSTVAHDSVRQASHSRNAYREQGFSASDSSNGTKPARRVQQQAPNGQRKRYDSPRTRDQRAVSSASGNAPTGPVRAPKRGAHSTTANDVAHGVMANSMWGSANQRGKQSSRNAASGFSSNAQGSKRAAVADVASSVGSGIGSLLSHTRLLKALGVLLVAVLLIGGVDALATSDKIYSGVKVGDIDLSGKTKDEATELIQGEYASRVATNTAVFFVDDQAMSNVTQADTQESLQEQISYEESLDSRSQWTVPASKLEATLNVEDLANRAFQVGREDGGIFGRIGAAIFGNAIVPECSFNEGSLTTMREEMTKRVGQMRVNYNIEMKDSSASVTQGNDGNEVTREWLVQRLNETFLSSDARQNYLLETEYVPLQITQEQAQKTADSVNASINAGAQFVYEDQTWTASREDLSSWIATEIVPEGSGFRLKPVVNENVAKSTLLSTLRSNISQDGLTVTFDKNAAGEISVSSNATGTVPMVSDAVTQMNDTFFVTGTRNEAPKISIATTDLPSSMSLDDAKNFGIVGEISSFTTQYATGAEARNHNIHTAADYLTNSIAKANGGTWSFNDTAGEATVERGYQNAGAIVEGEYSDAIGGGICQVATTVFNSIYLAGYPVTERHNHTLYIASYPEGRDAAIAFPYMDLVWQNDSSSDVLLVMSYTNSSVTATLMGVSPNYQVSTEYGEWKEGTKFTTKYRIDDSLAAGKEYVETTGVDGSSITIVRTVKDASGQILHEDAFTSVYDPKNEVIVKGAE